MSRQLTISSLFSSLALVTLALFARAGDVAGDSVVEPALVQVEAASGSEA